MGDFIRREICEGVAFNSIADDRFKIGRLSVTLVVPLNRQTAAANALLSSVLTRSCQAYPDMTALNKRLNELYGAALYAVVRKIGEFQIITLTASGLEDRFALHGESVSSELADLLCNILFEPNLTAGHFVPEDVEQERRQLLEDIDAEYNDKRFYAINRCIEIMCRDELFSISRYGGREEVAALTQEQLVAAWKELLDKAKVEIYMQGRADPSKALERFTAFFGSRPRRLIGSTKHISEVKEVRHIVETDEITQSKLVLGYRFAYPVTNRQRVTAMLLSAVLGGTPTSKLFANVREKQSLCYYCACANDNEKALLIVDSGVEVSNIQKTEEAILEQVELLQDGKITEEELVSAKLAVKNAYLSAMDNLPSIQAFYLQSILRSERLSPDEAAELAETITKEEIVDMAASLRLDTVFSLVGNE